VTEAVGTHLAQLAGGGAPVSMLLEADITQVATSSVWGLLPGAHFGTDEDRYLICNTHTDGPNLVEENGGLALVNVARYFARLPREQRKKSMVFLAATGHFGHGLLHSSADWIDQHPQIMRRAVGCMTIEHFGCKEWEDVADGAARRYRATGKLQQTWVYLTAAGFNDLAPGPADPFLLQVFANAIAGSRDRAAMLSGGPYLGEGAAFHRAGVPTIGYLGPPLYLCKMSGSGEIDKVDVSSFREQLMLTVKCLLAMQEAAEADLKHTIDKR
jgi:hypothetical protein